MSVYVLGPAIESVTEPETTPTAGPGPGRVGMKFDDVSPTLPGGIVNFSLLSPVAPTDLRPEHVHAFYTNPPSKVPALALRTPDWFLGSGSPSGSVAVPQPPADASGPLQIKVSGVVPGIHHVQTILEYAS